MTLEEFVYLKMHISLFLFTSLFISSAVEMKLLIFLEWIHSNHFSLLEPESE